MARPAKPAAATPEEVKRAIEAQRHAAMRAAKRLSALKAGSGRLIPFTQLTMPHPAEPDNPDRSRYQPAKHHHCIAEALEELLLGEKIQKLIISMPPRHGKSELASRRFPAFVLGRQPHWEIIQATYNDVFAQDFGRDVREILRAPSYGQLFPGVKLKKGSAAADRLEVDIDGMAAGGAVFVGRGGSLTGRGADLLIADDLVKDRVEASSAAIREQTWRWFQDVFLSRAKDESCRVVLIMTRWHEDDVIGRITDPKNPCYVEEEAATWHILDLPALAFHDDPLGRAEGDALWPSKFSRDFLLSVRRRNPQGFSALYQGRPTPEEGSFFKRDELLEYERSELPDLDKLRIYAASDHAVSEKQTADKTAMPLVGVDEDDTIWVLPELVWDRIDTLKAVERMIDLMRRYQPQTWWAETEQISRSIGPFLRKRMLEERVYCTVEPVPAAKDKLTRAQALKGRAAMGKIRFPKFASWWPDAKDELLKFPNGRHDDFVDALAHIGRQLGRLHGRTPVRKETVAEPPPGTIAWIKWAAKAAAATSAAADTGGF